MFTKDNKSVGSSNRFDAFVCALPYLEVNHPNLPAAFKLV